MPIELTEEERQALDGTEGPVRLIDPWTQATYVLLREDLYERIKTALTKASRPGEAYPAIDRAFAEGWSDSMMADDDRYEELKR